MKNLKSLAFLGVLAICFSLTTCMQKPKTIRFGLIADIQYCDCETRGSRFYRNSLIKLDSCIDFLNQEKVQFTVNLGDLVDRDTPDNLEAILVRLDRLNNKVYNTTGNHDYGGITDNETLYTQLGMPASYYSFQKGKWRFIMLNTNEVASYANITGTPLEAELAALTEAITLSGRVNGASYNGGISRRQLEWLHNELESAEKKKEKVIILSHHPLYAAPGLTALNDLEILEVLASFPCVKAGISGHHHPGDFGIYKDIPFITTQGMIETKKENAYGIVELTADQIILTGYGRTKSHTLPVR